ncbi:hypothetical protein GQ44DRAFT_832153 [Phaeosphaeriaceae sp. PMI808]|nr:hypothetical protein GQ44DRAFT_832153 [Phaeosphaeriaceae sp. PMI808]
MELEMERKSALDHDVSRSAQPQEGSGAQHDITATPKIQFVAARTSTQDFGDVEKTSSIADATISCRQSLTKCLDVKSLKDDWAEDRLADFKLWDAGVGASSNRKSSLEERLASKPHVRNVVLNLLMVIKITIDQCGELGRKVDQHTKAIPEALYEQPKEDAEGPSLSVADQAGVDIHSANLLEAVQTADTLLNDLARLGAVIRKAAIKSHIEKADGEFRDSSADLQALKKHLTRIVLFRPQHLEERRAIFWQGPGINFFEMSTPEQHACLSNFGLGAGKTLGAGEMTEVQQRLMTANLRRNHRFRYSQRHALKLEQGQVQPARSTVPDLAHISGATTETKSNANVAGGPSPQFTTTTSLTPTGSPENVSTETKEQRGSYLSDTTASAINTESMDAPEASVAPSQQSGTDASAVTSRIKTQYPQPPRLKERAITFKCPCCCTPLERKVHGTRRWRKHIVRDLEPYTCILDNCVTPDAFFAEKYQWLQHITDDHSHLTSYWECHLCEDSVQLGSEEMFISHIMEQHRRAVKENQIPTFLKVCAKPKILDGMTCPLCSVGAIDQDESGELLLDHIAEHIHSFALTSLPLLYADEHDKKDEEDDEEDDKKEQQPEKNEYFKSNPYFAQSDENSSNASRGTILESEDTDNQLSSVNALSIEGTDKEKPHASLVESMHPLERSEATDEDSKMSAFKDLMTDKRSLEQRLHERQLNTESWRSTMADTEEVAEESSSQGDDESLTLEESTKLSPSQDVTPEVLPGEEQLPQGEKLTLTSTKQGHGDEEEDDDEDDDDEGSEYEDLSGSLRAEMVQSAFDGRQFLPRGALDHLVTQQSVRVAMDIDQPTERNTILEEYIMSNARAVFAIAVYIRLPRLCKALRLFLENDFGDANLPIDMWSGELIKSKSKNHPFVAMERPSRRATNRIWTWSRIYDFQEEQWKFIAPVISTSIATYDMGERIMPFIKKHANRREGSFAVVSQYEIHRDHFEDPPEWEVQMTSVSWL